MYRTEIDGLRAFSVILIILYHLNVPGLHGAYVSVDVFFVISGFLISWIIVDDMQRGRFTFSTFYYRRVTRIMPTLFAAVGLAMLGAAVVMTPEDLVYAGKQGAAAVLSVSNIFYWQATGYWDPDARSSLFLHTWTLGVEEQFYLVYPLALFLAFRAGGRRGVLALLLVMAVGGMVWTESLVRDYPEAAFYLMPLRLYEFAIGGLGSLLMFSATHQAQLDRFGPLLSVTGIALVVGSMAIMDLETVFPGVSAVPVCVGTLALILAGGRGPAAPVLRLGLLTWVGRASYSIYLVHWPLIVLYRYLNGPVTSPLEDVLLFATTMLLGGAIYRGVDNAFRVRREALSAGPARSPSFRVGMISLAGVAVLGFCVATVAGGGWTWRVPAAVDYLAGRTVADSWRETKEYMDRYCQPAGEVFCGERRADGRNILLLGDSRGKDVYIALRTAYPDYAIRASVAIGCAPIFDPQVAYHRRYPDCPEFNRRRLEEALAAPPEDIIFLAAHFVGFRPPYILETVERLAAAGKRVYLVGDSQYIERGQSMLSIAVRHGRVTGLGHVLDPYLVAEPFRFEREFADRVDAAGATFIRSRDFFANGAGGYRLYTRDGGDLLLYDHVHLTVPGAIEYGRYLAQRYPLAGAGSDDDNG